MNLANRPWWFLFFVLCLELICCEMQYGIEGENFTFEVKVDQHMSEIIWKKEKDRVVEWEWQDQVRYLNSLQGRAFLNKENGSLTIFNLQKNDAGTYVLEYLDSERKIKSLTHVLSVIGPFSEPEISCNITANDTKLRCTTDFHLPVSYTWEIDSMTSPSEAQEISISKNHNPSTRVKCSIKFSQTEKSSQINLTQCSQAEEGRGCDRSVTYGLTFGVVVFVIIVALIYLYKKGKIPLGNKRAALNSSVDGLEECHPLGSPEKPDTKGGVSFQNVDLVNEKQEGDDNLNKEDSPVTDEPTMKNGVNQNNTLKENSSLLDKHADDCGVNAGSLKS